LQLSPGPAVPEDFFNISEKSVHLVIPVFLFKQVCISVHIIEIFIIYPFNKAYHTREKVKTHVKEPEKVRRSPIFNIFFTSFYNIGKSLS